MLCVVTWQKHIEANNDCICRSKLHEMTIMSKSHRQACFFLVFFQFLLRLSLASSRGQVMFRDSCSPARPEECLSVQQVGPAPLLLCLACVVLVLSFLSFPQEAWVVEH